MRGGRHWRGGALALAVAGLVATGGWAVADELPAYMEAIAGSTSASAADVATRDMLALNTGMFELYGDAARVFQRNILGRHPVILGLFSGAGGRFILYRPGQAPLEAPAAPITYQLLKSVGHSTMALSQVVGPYLDNPGDQSWRGAMRAYRSRMQSALDGLDATPMPAEWRANNRTILENNLAFMDTSLDGEIIGFQALEDFARKQAPFLELNIAWAAQTQVAHWMSVLGEWKAMLGPDWDKTYAASNSIYVARQNNVLFSVLAQFFGPEAINDRLLLIETTSFTTTPQEMLDVITRIVADRAVGALFFGNDRLMDYELMGGDARDAIKAESAKRGVEAFLPPPVPFGSRQWPTLITTGPGPASLADLK